MSPTTTSLTTTSFYRSKAKYGGLQLSEGRRLRQLEDENRRLKHLVADLTLDNTVLKGLLGKSSDARAHAVYGISERRAGALVAVGRSTARYRTRPGRAGRLTRAAAGTSRGAAAGGLPAVVPLRTAGGL